MRRPPANRRCAILFDVFGYRVSVILARDIVATGKRLGADLVGCAAAYVTTEDAPMRGTLVFDCEPTNGIIAHEASHAVRAMFLAVGAKDTDDEQFAYHLAHLVHRIHQFLGR